MMTALARCYQPNVAATFVALALSTPAPAQAPLTPGELQISTPADCAALSPVLDGRDQGGQWLIGEDVPLYGLVASRSPMNETGTVFERVTCYASGEGPDAERVFVADGGGSLCGWVDRADLVDERRDVAALFDRGPQQVCAPPRAMPLQELCDRLGEQGDAAVSSNVCQGVPRGLRAKGVMIGATAATVVDRYPFLTAPRNGNQRESHPFFSVLEIHDSADGDEGPMVLVGDGDGDVFGWLDLRALELWPTRLGLFYDTEGEGAMFQRQGPLIQNWRNGSPAPDIEPGLDPVGIRDFVHGGLPLLSYPIVRTIDTSSDVGADPDAPAYHEVIFLGQTGEGSASQLLLQANLASRIEAVQRLNLMIVADTTESMRDYLPAMRDGIADFAADYAQRRIDPANRLPDVRLGFYAYSDFQAPEATALGDPVDTEAVLPPTPLGGGFDLQDALGRITTHQGLNDAVGGRREAALEAVVQLSASFDEDRGWFGDGPRVILHLADHGSRDSVNVEEVLSRLSARGAFYIPVAVLTDDRDEDRRRVAREQFEAQAVAMLAPLTDGAAAPGDVARINLTDPAQRTAAVVRERLDLIVQEVIQTVAGVRRDLGGEIAADAAAAQDVAASRIRLDDALRDQFGLDTQTIGAQAIVQASTGFAPLRVGNSGARRAVDWTYTIALEPAQADLLRRSFEQLCGLIGSPRQSENFRRVIVALASAFSGDELQSNPEVLTTLSELRDLPGAEQSFLAQPADVLIQRADSTDPAMRENLRRDVCWTSYHLTNMDAGTYARPDQVVWSGREFTTAPGESVVGRRYRYKPGIGAEAVYLPSFFFVAPSVVALDPGGCGFFC